MYMIGKEAVTVLQENHWTSSISFAVLYDGVNPVLPMIGSNFGLLVRVLSSMATPRHFWMFGGYLRYRGTILQTLSSSFRDPSYVPLLAFHWAFDSLSYPQHGVHCQ
jgi:hypothetical protein